MSPAAYLSMQKKALEATTGTNFHIETDNGSNSAIFLLGLWYRAILDVLPGLMAGYVNRKPDRLKPVAISIFSD